MTFRQPKGGEDVNRCLEYFIQDVARNGRDYGNAIDILAMTGQHIVEFAKGFKPKTGYQRLDDDMWHIVLGAVARSNATDDEKFAIIADHRVQPSWSRRASCADALAHVRTDRAIAVLRYLADDSHPDVAEAARDALECSP